MVQLPTMTEPPAIVISDEFREEGGSAHMDPDGTIVLMIRLTNGHRSVADELLRFPPSNPHYQELLERLGGLKIGESKPLPPWKPWTR